MAVPGMTTESSTHRACLAAVQCDPASMWWRGGFFREVFQRLGRVSAKSWDSLRRTISPLSPWQCMTAKCLQGRVLASYLPYFAATPSDWVPDQLSLRSVVNNLTPSSPTRSIAVP